MNSSHDAIPEAAPAAISSGDRNDNAAVNGTDEGKTRINIPLCAPPRIRTALPGNLLWLAEAPRSEEDRSGYEVLGN